MADLGINGNQTVLRQSFKGSEEPVTKPEEIKAQEPVPSYEGNYEDGQKAQSNYGKALLYALAAAGTAYAAVKYQHHVSDKEKLSELIKGLAEKAAHEKGATVKSVNAEKILEKMDAEGKKFTNENRWLWGKDSQQELTKEKVETWLKDNKETFEGLFQKAEGEAAANNAANATEIVVKDAGKPAADAGKPAADAGKPAADAGKPAADAGKPAADAGKGTADAGNGTVETKQKTQDVKKPVEGGAETNAPAANPEAKPAEDGAGV